MKLQTKAMTVYKRAQGEAHQSDRGVGPLSAFALAGSEETDAATCVVTAPILFFFLKKKKDVYGLGVGGRKLAPQTIRDGMLAAAAIGYLCKHNATLSAVALLLGIRLLDQSIVLPNSSVMAHVDERRYLLPPGKD